MNAEIARKREEAERAREEELRRQTEQVQAPAANDAPRPQSKSPRKPESKRA
ncbi:MAG TPA: hypothetical protein VFS52_15265 [Steroidobacteraceae bacterium]|nr:hypothetical protein [Steroidobacteraceae bacterium]